VRSLVGLERDAARKALSRFLDDRTYTRAQIDFVWVVVTHLTERGIMDVELLYEPPFTDHPARARRPVQRLRRRRPG
jgi:type I restriction enzyme R subunit